MRADILIEIGKLKRQRGMLFPEFGKKVTMPDFESKVHFFDSEIRRLERQSRVDNEP